MPITCCNSTSSRILLLSITTATDQGFMEDQADGSVDKADQGLAGNPLQIGRGRCYSEPDVYMPGVTAVTLMPHFGE